ncbi:MAG: hypothetical protein HN742_08990 [Lentisphaerae bacterium]|mgnify:FL=1|jgi:hypothetical protein|nr:hypothetical protein [Lentisphaerota bacterium]MBT5610644.1 hypothetical protein [Lentisphaerota bacterium]MBT7057301.1 hypothetical protein [Lentisphaerota bacterium]MBT7841995.1 hypothetical protein [Lentisphaerota bacterium]
MTDQLTRPLRSMKLYVSACLLLILGVCSARAAEEREKPFTEDSVVCGMAEKGAHGLVNMVTGCYEFPMQIYKGYQRGIERIDAPAGSRSLGMLLGVPRGLSHAVGRTAWGCIQFAGFWTRNPTTSRDLRQLFDSEYSWEMGTAKPLFGSNFEEASAGVADRFARGLHNLLGAPLEIPGQIRKADVERRVFVGIPKGLWYGSSRLIYGVADFALFFVPGYEDSMGVPFDEVYGWDALNGNYYTNIPE